MDRTTIRERLGELAVKAWDAYDAAKPLKRVEGAMPILFFGDVDGYLRSDVRILTAGKNPSDEEFPSGDEFKRFPLAAEEKGRDPERYLQALSAYFAKEPYWRWFRSYEEVLRGADASYFSDAENTALQTDICSPVPTRPTWTRLDEDQRKALEVDGVSLWHQLLEVLRPKVVLISTAQTHLERIHFEALDEKWETLHTFDKTKDGNPRARPYEVLSRRYRIGGEPMTFVFGRAAQMPFSLLSDQQKNEIGRRSDKSFKSNDHPR